MNPIPLYAHQQDKVAPEHRPAWAPFLTSLKENGYFKDNIPGSTGYCELFSAALAAFQLTSTHKNGKEGRPTAAARMDSVLKVNMHLLYRKNFYGVN